jgi:hypothetical protein
MLQKTVIANWSILLSVFLIGPLFLGTALGEDRITSDVKVKPLIQLNASEKRSLGYAANELLKQVYSARADIKYEDGKKASQYVEKGLALVRIIENALPEYEVKSTIKSGRLVYSDETRHKQFMVPIYSEWEDAYLLRPVMQRAGDEAVIREALEPVDEARVRLTRSFLDVRDAKSGLEQAAIAIKAEDYKKADELLLSIQSHVVSDFKNVDSRLTTARQALVQAAHLVRDHRYRQAASALRQAADLTEAYGKDMAADNQIDAQGAATEMKSLADTVETKKEAAIENIRDLWERVADFF